jgi:hypothetical protein
LDIGGGEEDDGDKAMSTESNLAQLGYKNMNRSKFPPKVDGHFVYNPEEDLWMHPFGNYMPPLEINRRETEWTLEQIVKLIAKTARDKGAIYEAQRRAMALAQCLDDKPTTM